MAATGVVGVFLLFWLMLKRAAPITFWYPFVAIWLLVKWTAIGTWWLSKATWRALTQLWLTAVTLRSD